LSISFVNFDIRNSTSVFFERTFHDLSLSSNSPDSNFSFHTTGYNLLAIGCSRNRSDSVVVCVVDGVQEFTRLRKERSDLTIVPSGENGFTIIREEDAVAFKSWDFDSEKLLSGLGVPDSDVVQRAGGEELRVTAWEADVINSFIMASVSQFWADIIGVAPVNSGLGSSAEEVSGIGGQRDGGNSSHNFSFLSDKEVSGANLGKSTVTRSEEEVTVGEESNAVDTLGEESLVWTNSFE
jgi:hypothetical protein